MNPNHYPPSPSYYRHSGADARDLVSPDYWTDSALVHLMRAGRKDGEPFADAVRNAFTCLALWFRSQSLPVPFYSAELDAAHKRLHRRPVLELLEIEAPFGPVDLGPFSLNATGTGNPQWISITRPPADEEDTGHLHSVRADSPLEAVAKLAPWLLEQYLDAECELAALRARVAELEAAALTAVSRPVAPTLDTPAVEWTDDELEAWVVAKHGNPTRPNEWRKCWNWLGDANRWTLVRVDEPANAWHGHAIGNPPKGLSATEAARILGAVKPDPFAALLEVETLADWRKCYESIRHMWPAGDLAVGPDRNRWYITGVLGSDRDIICDDVAEMARTLHRILTGAKP